jgi:hypothetical protein
LVGGAIRQVNSVNERDLDPPNSGTSALPTRGSFPCGGMSSGFGQAAPRRDGDDFGGARVRLLRGTARA